MRVLDTWEENENVFPTIGVQRGAGLSVIEERTQNKSPVFEYFDGGEVHKARRRCFEDRRS